MSSEEEDTQALEAADLYSGDATFAEISAKLGVSKSHSQTLVRRGIALFKSVNENSIEEIAELGDPFVPHQGLETNPPQPQAIFPLQDPRTGSYMLETQGISRRVMLTPTDIMVFDLFKNGGFSGDLSDFISDAISFMYNNLRPTERER